MTYSQINPTKGRGFSHWIRNIADNITAVIEVKELLRLIEEESDKGNCETSNNYPSEKGFSAAIFLSDLRKALEVRERPHNKERKCCDGLYMKCTCGREMIFDKQMYRDEKANDVPNAGWYCPVCDY